MGLLANVTLAGFVILAVENPDGAHEIVADINWIGNVVLDTIPWTVAVVGKPSLKEDPPQDPIYAPPHP